MNGDTDRRRGAGPIVFILLVLAVGGGIWWSYRDKSAESDAIPAGNIVRGIVGSEKVPFFADPRVIEAFGKHGLSVTVDKSGSREIASRPNLKDYDFAFPAGEPAAVKVQETAGVQKSFAPFYTVMAVASWKPIVGILEANSIVKKEGGVYYILDMHGLLDLTVQQKRWKDLAGSDAYPINRSVLISSTDVRKSNSAAMYLSIASYLFNGENVVQTRDEVESVLPKVVPLFLRQGWQESSSAGPFEDYKIIGMGKTALVMIYEAQFVEEMIKNKSLPNRDQMVLLYPRPTVFAKQMLIPISAKGETVGALLENDETLQRLAAEYGYRTRRPDLDKQLWKQHDVDPPDNLVDVVNPPRFEIVEALIQGIEKQIQ